MRHTLIYLLLTLASLPATADSDMARTPLNPVYKKECGACHTPFPANLLSAADWRKTMSGLERHFGSDASLDAKTQTEIGAWLARHAGRGGTAKAGVEPRITETPWFKREHDEVPAKLWRDPKVKSPVNCAACHRGADHGRYGENEIVLPGMPGRRE